MGNVILGLLLLAPQTLYTLRKQFEQSISLFYSSSPGSIRAALATLEERGLARAHATVEHGRSKRVYEITDAGRAAFRAWMLGPVEQGDLETASLSKLFFLGLLPERDRGTVLADLRVRIAAAQRHLEELAAQLDGLEVPEEYRHVFRYQRLVLDYGIGAHRHGAAFFDRVTPSAE